jgi:uncharacterized protein YukE
VNDLIASYDDHQDALTGIGLYDSCQGVSQAIASGTWIDVTLAGAGAGFEAFSAGVDPIGTLASAGLSWLLEHVDPLRELLEDLTGNPDILLMHADTWANMAAEAAAIGEEMQVLAQSHQEEWTGEAAAAFRGLHAELKLGVDSLGAIFDSMRAATAAAAGIIQTTYELVRDLIADLIVMLCMHAPVWLGLIAATAGVALPLCLVDAIILIVQISGMIFSIVTAAVQTYMNFQVLMGA